jgi:hypothetical protein
MTLLTILNPDSNYRTPPIKTFPIMHGPPKIMTVINNEDPMADKKLDFEIYQKTQKQQTSATKFFNAGDTIFFDSKSKITFWTEISVHFDADATYGFKSHDEVSSHEYWSGTGDTGRFSKGDQILTQRITVITPKEPLFIKFESQIPNQKALFQIFNKNGEFEILQKDISANTVHQYWSGEIIHIPITAIEIFKTADVKF